MPKLIDKIKNKIGDIAGNFLENQINARILREIPETIEDDTYETISSQYRKKEKILNEIDWLDDARQHYDHLQSDFLAYFKDKEIDDSMRRQIDKDVKRVLKKEMKNKKKKKEFLRKPEVKAFYKLLKKEKVETLIYDKYLCRWERSGIYADNFKEEVSKSKFKRLKIIDNTHLRTAFLLTRLPKKEKDCSNLNIIYKNGVVNTCNSIPDFFKYYNYEEVHQVELINPYEITRNIPSLNFQTGDRFSRFNKGE